MKFTLCFGETGSDSWRTSHGPHLATADRANSGSAGRPHSSHRSTSYVPGVRCAVTFEPHLAHRTLGSSSSNTRPLCSKSSFDSTQRCLSPDISQTNERTYREHTLDRKHFKFAHSSRVMRSFDTTVAFWGSHLSNHQFITLIPVILPGEFNCLRPCCVELQQRVAHRHTHTLPSLWLPCSAVVTWNYNVDVDLGYPIAHARPLHPWSSSVVSLLQLHDPLSSRSTVPPLHMPRSTPDDPLYMWHRCPSWCSPLCLSRPHCGRVWHDHLLADVNLEHALLHLHLDRSACQFSQNKKNKKKKSQSAFVLFVPRIYWWTTCITSLTLYTSNSWVGWLNSSTLILEWGGGAPRTHTRLPATVCEPFWYSNRYCLLCIKGHPGILCFSSSEWNSSVLLAGYLLSVTRTTTCRQAKP